MYNYKIRIEIFVPNQINQSLYLGFPTIICISEVKYLTGRISPDLTHAQRLCWTITISS